MMESRYFCPECERQFAEPSSPLVPFNGTHCPVCGGQYVSLVTYSAAFDGGDYDPEGRWRATPGAAPSTPSNPLAFRAPFLLMVQGAE